MEAGLILLRGINFPLALPIIVDFLLTSLCSGIILLKIMEFLLKQFYHLVTSSPTAIYLRKEFKSGNPMLTLDVGYAEVHKKHTSTYVYNVHLPGDSYSQ